MRASACVWRMGVSIAALMTSGTAMAQSAPDGEAEDAEIVVTGTRIVQDGYQSPSPVTVLSSENLLKAVPSSVGESLRTLPALQNSVTPNSGNHANSNRANHGNFLNLRNLGPERVLVLLDGVRIPPTTFSGLVDTNVLPDLLIQRVDVVTGGASAAYGSDAVSGVVNFVLDTNLRGVRGVAQAGMTDRGDAENYRLGLAGGFDLGENVHVLLAGSTYKTQEFNASQRQYANTPCGSVGLNPNSGSAGTASNPFVTRCNLRYGFAGVGGIVGGGAGGLSGMTFNRDGTFVPYASVAGDPTGSAGTTIGNGPGYFRPSDFTIGAGIETYNAFGRIGVDLGNTEFYVQAALGQQKTNYTSLVHNCIPCTIFSDNAYLSDEARAALGDIDSFRISREFLELGGLPTKEKTDFFMATAGLKGRIGNGWRWDVAYTYGRSKVRVAQRQWNNERLYAAMDAVRDPGTGNIVCNVSLTEYADLYPGCVPINILGPGSVSAEAANYILDVARYSATNETNDIVASISGEAFDLPAGPVSLALGGEYRDGSLDFNGNGDPNFPPAYTGLRTPRSADAAAQQFYFLNIGRTSGSVKVYEGFGELAVPIVKSDAGFIRALDVNGAMRYTHYSTSGSVTTWKVGATMDLGGALDGVRLRATRSRDIRAPFLNDLFLGQSVAQGNVTDPHTNTSGGAVIVSGGNPNLDPEEGNTFTAGVVYQPTYLPGFSVSLDYWKIKLTDAIGTQGANAILADCEASNGLADVCDLIVRPLPFDNRTPENRPTSILNLPQNLASQTKEGIDLDLNYRSSLGAGDFSVGVFATYIFKDITQSAPNSVPFDSAGEAISPHFSANINLNYSTDTWGLFINERVIGPHGRATAAGQVFAEPDVKTVFYTNATFTYKLPVAGNSQDLFLTVSNLFDRAPPLQPGTGVSITFPASGELYDLVGRRFTAGVRFRF